MKESKAKTLYCPHIQKPCMGSECMMWAWDFDSSDGPGSQNLDPDKMGDCSLTHRRRTLWRSTEDMPEERLLSRIDKTLEYIWEYGIKKGLIKA